MNIKEINKMQNDCIKNTLVAESYEWENKHLTSYLIGKIPLERERYRYSGRELTKEQLEQNDIIEKINNILKKYNNTMTLSNQELIDLENLYEKLDLYIERAMTSYYEIKKQLKFNIVFLLNGPGGIGKSQFLYEFSNELKDKFEYLCIYGKYCDCIYENIFDEIREIIQSRKFYFIIDAFNELKEEIRDNLIKFIQDNKNNNNLRIIISYRDNSLAEKEIEKIKKVIDQEEIFTGVSADDALEKISEK